ncbi:MAG TPA: DUF2269 family protein [Candidatus Limnocylindrales bacterium]|nr:DUF2269 family protein [Candidatus Limnocylindrales bacterium]
MLVFKFLHIATMFGAVTLLMGSIVFLDVIARRGDVAAYLRLDAIVQRTDLVGVVLFIAGIIFGLLAAIMGAFDLTAGWLLIAYVLVAALFFEGLVLTVPQYNRIREAVRAVESEDPQATLQRMIRAPEHVALVIFAALLWLAVIFVMVVKPSPF